MNTHLSRNKHISLIKQFYSNRTTVQLMDRWSLQTSYSCGACQQNGLFTANCCNLLRLSVRVALKNSVCRFFVSASNMIDRSSAKEVSSRRSASSNTCDNKALSVIASLMPFVSRQSYYTSIHKNQLTRNLIRLRDTDWAVWRWPARRPGVAIITWGCLASSKLCFIISSCEKQPIICMQVIPMLNYLHLQLWCNLYNSWVDWTHETGLLFDKPIPWKVVLDSSTCSEWNPNLVGVRTRANTPWGSSASFWRIGNANAAVFPLPVFAQPMQSLPSFM